MSQAESWRGKVGVLHQEEIAQFLSGPMVARLASLDAGGWPYVIPCWQEWDAVGWWVIPRERSVWAYNLERDPRCAVTVDESGGQQRKIVAQCTARLVERPNVGGRWVEIGKRMAVRYLGENGMRYFEPTSNQPRWLFHLEPKSLVTWQGQDWAARYK
jgi:hypothetical protein